MWYCLDHHMYVGDRWCVGGGIHACRTVEHLHRFGEHGTCECGETPPFGPEPYPPYDDACLAVDHA